MFDWMVQPELQKTPTRHQRRRRAVERMLPSVVPQTGGGVQPDPFSLYPCTRMHGADFEAEFHVGDAASELHSL